MFAGGWTLAAAAECASDPAADAAAGRPCSGSAACLETLDGLGRLVDRSLVVVEHEAETRYQMLETIRQGAIAHQRGSFALVALERDDPIRAAPLLGAADGLWAASGSVRMSIEQEEYEAAIERLRERLGADVLERARADGRALTTEQAVAFALSG